MNEPTQHPFESDDTLTVHVFQDTVCPWCRIGKKNLSDALALWEGPPVFVMPRAFFLNPDTPAEGLDFRKHLGALKGGEDQLASLFAPVEQMGEKLGLPFHFDKIKRSPNTLLSHQLIALAPELLQSQVVDAIYKAYFEDGRDIGQLETLLEIATENGLDTSMLQGQLERKEALAQVQADYAFAVRNNIRGVPFFIIGRYGLSGAQPIETILKAMKLAVEERSNAS